MSVAGDRPEGQRRKFDARAAAVSALVLVAVFALIGIPGALLLGHAFFEDWGFIVGPGAWIVGAIAASRSVGLGVGEAFIASLVAIVPNALGGAIGLHWVGVAAGVACFALAIGRFAALRDG